MKTITKLEDTPIELYSFERGEEDAYRKVLVMIAQQKNIKTIINDIDIRLKEIYASDERDRNILKERLKQPKLPEPSCLVTLNCADNRSGPHHLDGNLKETLVMHTS